MFVLKLVVCAMILAAGLGCAWTYLLPRSALRDSARNLPAGDRPWRRLGAGICLVLSVMFVLGVYLVDVPDHPRTYATYWLVMMVLVLWLCALATKDVFYTRKMIMDRRFGKGRRPGAECKDSSP